METLQQDFLDWLDKRIAKCETEIDVALCGSQRWKYVDQQETFEEVKKKFEEIYERS